MTPALTMNPPVSSVEVTFDMPIQAASFTTADVVITGPGGSIAATGISPVSGNTYRIPFAAQTTNGSYTVRVGPAWPATSRGWIRTAMAWLAKRPTSSAGASPSTASRR